MAYTIKPKRLLHPLKSAGYTKAEKARVEDWLRYEEDFLRRPHPRTTEERERVNRIGRKLDSLCHTICKEVLDYPARKHTYTIVEEAPDA